MNNDRFRRAADERAWRDPERDGPRTFDAHLPRLRIAAACCERSLQPKELPAISRQSDSNARTSAETLLKYGVLTLLGEEASTGVLFKTRAAWQTPVEEARRRSEAGQLSEGQRLLLISPADAARFYELMADRDRTDPRLMWAARTPDSSESALIVALDPRIDEDSAVRLDGELRRVGIAPIGLRLGRQAAFAELRGFASSSVPRAFGEDD